MKILLAVSGGVDSVAMLHSLVNADDFAKLNFVRVKYVVAYFDHGIRTESAADGRFVKDLAEKYDIDFEIGSASLGIDASESIARIARWDFLNKTKDKYNTDFIATAHHSDDVFETQLINLIRGSGRRGVTVLSNTKNIIRPLINRTKSEIYEYALKNNLEFVEDSTNLDTKYLRNKLRLSIIPRLGSVRTELKKYLAKVNELNPLIDEEVRSILKTLVIQTNNNISINRSKFNALPQSVKQELIREALDKMDVIHDKQKISSAMIKRLCSFASRKDSNRYLHISKYLQVYISKENLVLEIRK